MDLEEIVKIIEKGGVIICPTDTVYGLIADATNKKAVGKIFKIKKREKEKPIPIFVKDLAQAKKIAEINKGQEKFLKKVWPGKVTIVLMSKTKHPTFKIYGVDKKTIALRIPNHKVVLDLVKHISPLTGTSANISGKPASGNIKEVIKQFEKQKIKPDLIIDSGNLKKSKPSKIIDLTVQPPKILR